MFTDLSTDILDDKIIIASAMYNDYTFSMSFDIHTGKIIDSDCKEGTQFYNDLERFCRMQLSLKKVGVINLVHSKGYSPEHYALMQKWHDSLVNAENTLTEMTDSIVNDGWLTELCDQTIFSIIDKIADVRIAFDSRLSNR